MFSYLLVRLDSNSSFTTTDAVSFKTLLISCLEKSIGAFGAALPCDLLKFSPNKQKNQAHGILRVYQQDEKLIISGLVLATIGLDEQKEYRWSVLESKASLMDLSHLLS